MITIANFSHPLSPEAKEYIDRRHALGGGVTEIIVPAQFDLTQPLTPQVEKMINEAIAKAGGNKYNIDCFIPPALSYAAVYIAGLLTTANMLVMARDGASLPPKFMPAQIVYCAEL